MASMRAFLPRAAMLLALATSGCATYRDELARGQTAFEQNQHERALAIFRPLEQEQEHFSPSEQARYAYLRGMTDFRIGYRAEAWHWLVIAAELDRAGKGLLPRDWKRRMEDALADLNAIVLDKGVAALSNDPAKATPGHAEKKVEGEDE
jgi:hypothetical protein